MENVHDFLLVVLWIIMIVAVGVLYWLQYLFRLDREDLEGWEALSIKIAVGQAQVLECFDQVGVEEGTDSGSV